MVYIKYLLYICYDYVFNIDSILPFINPSNYSTYGNVDDGSVSVTLPSSLQFGGFHYQSAYVSDYNYHYVSFYSLISLAVMV